MPADTDLEFINAAEARFSAAQRLMRRAKKNPAVLSSACYLAGYLAEMLLKAAIIRSRGKNRLSDFDVTQARYVHCDCTRTLYCPACQKLAERTHTKNDYHHHNLTKLMEALRTAPNFTSTYGVWFPRNRTSDLFTLWNSERRYDDKWIATPAQAQAFIGVVRSFNATIRRDLGI